MPSALFGVISLVALPHGTRTSRHEERHLTGATRAIVTDRGFLLFLGAILIGASIYMQNVATFPLHVQAAGYSTSVYGALQALNGIIVVLLELPITSWTGRRSRTRMVALGTLLVGLAFATLVVAKYQASLGVMFGLGAIVGPTLGTLAYAFSPDLLWISCGVAGVLAATLALDAGRHPARVLEVDTSPT